jgi:spermidine synthase
MLLSFNAERVNRLYAVDLIGAGFGCLLCPFLLARTGAGGVFVFVALLALFALIVAVPGAGRRVSIPAGVVVGLVGLWLLPTLDVRHPIPGKGVIRLTQSLRADTSRGRIFSEWSTNSRIDLIAGNPWRQGSIIARGTKIADQPPVPEQRLILQDAGAGTLISNFSEHPEALEVLRRSMYFAALQLKQEPRVFIIGIGGGNDVWAARAAGAKYVKAIELNAPILRIHRQILPEYSRALLDDPNIELIVGEGRSALMRDSGTYDVIQMTGIDTWTALTSGAYVLAENYLYTRESIESMYERLADDGILQIIRFARQMESLRMVSNIHAAFESMGVRDLPKSLIALKTHDGLMAILVKRGAFTAEETERVHQFAQDNGIRRRYLPGADIGGGIDEFLQSEDKASFIDEFPRNISPTTDDRPYFFNFSKWRNPWTTREQIREPTSISQGNPLFILSQLMVSIALSVVLIMLPAARLRGMPRRGAGRYLAYFASLGLGFILIEISVIQKLTLFLGHPLYSITVTLFTVLVFTGLGSLFMAGRFPIASRGIWVVPLGLAALLGGVILVSPWLVENLIGLALPARIVIAGVLLAPVSLLLGVPFAFGIRVLSERNASLIPWGWAINGCCSVVGSILSVVISMNLGFNIVLVMAASIYVLGFWALRREITRPAEAAPA